MLIRERLARKRPVFSFEFFPPRTEKGELTLLRSLERLAPLEPDFVSVTYGAGGSTRTRTIELVTRIRREFGIEAVAHLTCVGSTRAELVAVIDGLGDAGVQNILALRGDPPRGQERFEVVTDGLAHASELVELVRSRGNFCVGAACYPEAHPEAENAASDLVNLRRKVDAGVDFLVTQLFFEDATYFSFVERARAAGIMVPILAGIMPVTNLAQVERFTETCGATIPATLHQRLRDSDDDPQEVFWTGVSHSARQCEGLLDPLPGPDGRAPEAVPGIHFYTLNRSPAARAIFEIVKLARFIRA